MNLNELEHRHRTAVELLSRTKRDLEAAKRAAATARAVRDVLTAAAGACQQAAYAGVAACVSRCLTAIFGEDAYRCELEVKSSRGRPECRFRFSDKDGNEIDLMTAGAGGEVDVVAFALRLAAVVIARPPVRRLLVLDEPLRHLSKDHAERAKELFLAISQELDVQIIFSTHSSELACGRVIRF